GFYISLVQQNVTPPETFETSRQRELWEAEARALREKQEAQGKLQDEYRQYLRAQVTRYLEETLSPEERARLLDEKKQQIKREHKNAQYWTDAVLANLAQGRLHEEIERRLNLPTFPEWQQQLRSQEQEHQPGLPYAAPEPSPAP